MSPPPEFCWLLQLRRLRTQSRQLLTNHQQVWILIRSGILHGLQFDFFCGNLRPNRRNRLDDGFSLAIHLDEARLLLRLFQSYFRIGQVVFRLPQLLLEKQPSLSGFGGRQIRRQIAKFFHISVREIGGALAVLVFNRNCDEAFLAILNISCILQILAGV